MMDDKCRMVKIPSSKHHTRSSDPADTFADARHGAPNHVRSNTTSNNLELVNLLIIAAVMNDYHAVFLILARL